MKMYQTMIIRSLNINITTSLISTLLNKNFVLDVLPDLLNIIILVFFKFTVNPLASQNIDNLFKQLCNPFSVVESKIRLSAHMRQLKLAFSKITWSTWQKIIKE